MFIRKFLLKSDVSLEYYLWAKFVLICNILSSRNQKVPIFWTAVYNVQYIVLTVNAGAIQDGTLQYFMFDVRKTETITTILTSFLQIKFFGLNSKL